MKGSCLFLLAILLGMSGFYYWLLADTDLSDKWWIPFLLALGLSITVANIQGIFQAMRRLSSSNRHPRDWKDGELVGASGPVQALREPLKAPFSDSSCVMAEFDIKRIVSSSKSNTGRSNEIMGFLMTPCAIFTKRGQIRLVGFPLLDQTTEQVCYEDECYERAANYCATTQFKELGKSPLTILKELTQVLTDDDGDINEHFRSKDSFLSGGPDALREQFGAGSYELTEKVIPQGATITVFGTYNARKQAIDIGSGLSKLDHSLALASMSQVISRSFRASIIGTLIFGAITAAGHYFVLKTLGLAG